MTAVISKPIALIDGQKCRENIFHMANKARIAGVRFSPHFKTHQSRAVGEWFRQEGISEITVSSVTMAKYFAQAGWDDITIGIPVNICQLDEINTLAEQVRLSIFVTDRNSVKKVLDKVSSAISIIIEIDCGYHRTGVPHDDHITIQDIIDIIGSSDHKFRGFYCHSGNTYQNNGVEAILQVHNDHKCKLMDLADTFGKYNPSVEMGDTPACSVATSFEGIDVIHPGNFVFYDVMQAHLGSCMINQIAIAVACPIIFKNKNRMELVVYGGGVHLSKDYIIIEDKICFGLPVRFINGSWSDPMDGCYVSGLSQEHGMITVTDEVFDKYEVGDIIGILPIHSCMTADVLGEMQTTQGQALDHMRAGKFA